MIRITFNDNNVKEYKSRGEAKFRILEVIAKTKGQVRPVMATEVMGVTTGGVSVEMDLQVALVWSELANGWAVKLDEIQRR